MWESLLLSSRGGLSTRRIFAYVLSAVVAIFVWVLLSTSYAHADSAADATWSGANINYNSEQYGSAGTVQQGDSSKLPVGSETYSWSDSADHEDDIIYFDTGKDAATQTTAHFVIYKTDASNQLSDPHGQKDITVNPSGATPDTSTNCGVPNGVGWIVCPVSNFLANGMDTVFTILTSFVAVQPATVGNTHGDMYIAWNIMRTVANVAFIIVFLIIIYSQLTNIGITNYSIKKLLPRLIVAAILVNLSYYICAAAIDVSNILGYSIQELFSSIRQGLFHINNTTNNSSIYSWQSVTGAVLSGSTAGLAVGVGAVTALAATGGTITSAIFLLLPALLGLLLAIIVVLLILAARQAIITILLIIAPLAFVANLLPNTEKWFGEWRKLFMTMLIFFPAFSLVFGGSQLAGAIIIQNATSINIIILGMIVQIAPLVITPLLLRLSGDVLGKVAGIVNNPRKGLMDRTRNWANSRAEFHRQRGIGGELRGRNFARRASRGLEYRKHRLERGTERWKEGFNEYAAHRDVTSRAGQRIEVELTASKLNTENIQNDFKQAVEELRTGSAAGLKRLRAQDREGLLERGVSRFEEVLDRGGGEAISSQRRFESVAIRAIRNYRQADVKARVIANATNEAQMLQTQKFARAIDVSPSLQAAAGGIGKGGAQRALASALAVISKAREETIANAGKIIDSRNLTDAQITMLERGISLPGVNITVSQDIRAAALLRILGGPNTMEITNSMRDIDLSFSDVTSAKERQELQIIAGKALESNSAKPPEVGAGFIANLKQGLDFNNNPIVGPYGEAGMQAAIIAAINAEKIDAGKLQVAGKDYSDAIYRAVQNNSAAITPAARRRLKAELGTTLDRSRDASEKLGDSRPPLENLDSIL
jgi:hypothetical protein